MLAYIVSMPPALTALLAALSYGIADFLGGLGSRRAAALPVASLSQGAGAVVLLLLVPLLHSATPTLESLAWGAAAGFAGAAFLGLFYYLLAVGRMGIVAPVSAVWAVMVPVGAGILFGERPGIAALAGVVLAIGSTVMMSGGESTGRATKGLVGLSVLAGMLGGLWFVFLERAGAASGLWPLLSAKITSTLLTVAALWLLRRRISPGLPLSRAALWPGLASGVLEYPRSRSHECRSCS